MKKLILSGLTCLGILSIASAMAATQTINHKQKTTVNKNSIIHYMFVVSAKNGAVTHISKNHYQLSLQVPDVHQVLMFSDRPYRFAAYISGNALAKFWKSGKNNFTVDPPNAVLSSYNLYPTIVVLYHYKNHGDHVTFDFTSTQAITLQTLHHLTFTIDSVAPTISSITQGTQIAAAAAKTQTCDTVSSVALSGEFASTGIAYAVSAAACGGDAGIKYVYDQKATATTSGPPSISSVTDKTTGTTNAENTAINDSSSTCKSVTNVAGNLESAESPIADGVDVIACGGGSQLFSTAAKKYASYADL